MPKLSLTPEEKANNKRRKEQEFQQNRILSDWNFGNITKWEDVYKLYGYSPEYIQQHYSTKKGPLTFPELKAFLQEKKEKLDNELLQKSSPSANGNTPPDAKITSQTVTQSTLPALPTSVVVETISQVEQDIKREQDKDYGFKKSPNEKANCFWFQKKAIVESWDKLINQNKSAILILSGTGTGKTWMAGGILRRLLDANYHDGKTMSHIPYLYVTRASIVTKTERDLDREFCIGVEDTSVINIEQLRSQAGRFWLKQEKYVEGGEECVKWVWKKNIQPCVVEWDECQALKNEGSQQHQIACSMNDMGRYKPKQVFISATPFTKVSEAKCFAVATNKDLTYILGRRSGFEEGTRLTNETWPAYAKAIAYPNPPSEYNEAAVERLMQDLDEYVVRVKGVRPQFEAHNKVELIDFQSPEKREFYTNAWDRYLKKKAKLEAMGIAGAPVGMAILVQFLKFRMAAEICRDDILAKRMYEIVEHKGRAAVCAVNFKNTLISIVRILIEQYGVPRSKISLIWGGGQTQLTEKQKQKQKIQGLSDEQLEARGLSKEEILENLDLDEVEDRELIDIPGEYKLGAQSLEERQYEIDKFQKGESLYCLYTLRAGGVGLSLHHTDECVRQKCRKKPSGYVVEEDIPLIPIRQRETLVAPTWSPIELVQGIGRVPRLTSLSDTDQILIFYRGTIEGRVADIANRGLRCLSKIVKHKEPWSDMVINGGPELDRFVTDLPEDSDETGLVSDVEEEE